MALAKRNVLKMIAAAVHARLESETWEALCRFGVSLRVYMAMSYDSCLAALPQHVGGQSLGISPPGGAKVEVT